MSYDGMSPNLIRAPSFGTILISVLLLVLLISQFHDARGYDLAPLWIAASLWAEGATDAIYLGDTGVYTAAVTEEFAAAAKRAGYNNEAYAFVYPPLWAALVAPLTKLISFSTANSAMILLNIAALSTLLLLVYRTAIRRHPTQYLVVAALLLSMTSVGTYAILSSQLHVLVTLLLALTYERSPSGDQTLAGTALAMAAALKLYPALLAFLFLGTRQYRALVVFTVVGGALGGLSIALAGWPLHFELLNELSKISGSLYKGNIWNLDSLAVFAIGTDTLGFEGGESAIAKPTAWVFLAKSLPFAFLVFQVWRARADERYAAHPLFWPTAVLGFAFLAPLSWCFTYILPFAVAPLLLVCWPRPVAMAFLLTLVALTALPFVTISGQFIGSMPALQVTGSFAILALFIAFQSTLLLQSNRPWPEAIDTPDTLPVQDAA